MDMWRFIDGDVVAHLYRCGGSLMDMYRFIDGDVVAH